MNLSKEIGDRSKRKHYSFAPFKICGIFRIDWRKREMGGWSCCKDTHLPLVYSLFFKIIGPWNSFLKSYLVTYKGMLVFPGKKVSGCYQQFGGLAENRIVNLIFKWKFLISHKPLVRVTKFITSCVPGLCFSLNQLLGLFDLRW